MSSKAAGRFVQARGLRFHYEVSGRAGAPWLVFSNSLMTNLSVWSAQELAFRESYRILRYDQRGHGATEVPDHACTFDQLADDLEALCEALEVERAVLIGVSMGGVTALRMAERHPARVAAVIACDCQWFSPSTSGAMWDDRIHTARDLGMDGMVEPTVARWFRPAFVKAAPRGLRSVRHMIASTSLDGFVACARALQSFDLRPDFGRIEVPTCFLVGDSDGVLPTVMREMHRAMPGSTFVQVAEAGHLPNVEQPATFNHATQGFLIQIGWHA